eukprot:9589464-Heterocapsa_arctica.AAC.1
MVGESAETIIGQWRAVQQVALEVRSNDGVNTCQVTRRATTAWSGSSRRTPSCSSRFAEDSRR